MYPDVIAIRGQREEEEPRVALLSASWATCAAPSRSVSLNMRDVCSESALNPDVGLTLCSVRK